MKKIVFLTALFGALFLSACTGATTPMAETAVAFATDVAPTVEAAAPTVEAAATTVAGVCPDIDITALTTSGKDLYAQQCAGCHGAAGEGSGDFPALTGNSVVSADDATQLITNYFAVDAHPKTVTPDQLAGLLSFVRMEFGGGVAAVCPGAIELVQPSQ